MSLSQTLLQNVENIVESFVDKIVEKYSINKDELLSLWMNNNSSPKKEKQTIKPKLDSVNMDDISLERLHKCNKAELVALCKSRGCKCTGTKDVLIDRILGKDETAKPKSTAPVKEKTKSPTKGSSKKTEKITDVVKKLTADIPVIPIRKNTHGNLEHPETGLVFDRKTETVIGKQQDDGTISELEDEDIEACKKFKFRYNIPNSSL